LWSFPQKIVSPVATPQSAAGLYRQQAAFLARSPKRGLFGLLRWYCVSVRTEEPRFRCARGNRAMAKSALILSVVGFRVGAHMWNSLHDELREIFWLVSIIGGLSIMGVGLAVMLVQT
jgi:hypothetical protein